MKLWQGRFQKQLDQVADAFNRSIDVDCAMILEDIQGSIAHAKMLGATSIIASEDCEAIVKGLEGILVDVEKGALPIDREAEDVHMFVEQMLTERIGEAGKRLHTARSRNDQVATDLRLHLRRRIDELSASLLSVQDALIAVATEHTESVMPGYTHLQVAQPVTFGHHLMAYVQMFMRDLNRLEDCKARMNVLPLGSGALAATTHPIDRHAVKDLLGFDAISENSMDGVSDRDFVMELHSVLSLIMMHLSRLSEEMIIWSSQEFKFVELDDSFTTGSSIMPQKKNPDMCELIRGKTGRVYGNLMGALTMMKGLPLAYNKDMQEDKEAIFDSVETVSDCLTVLAPMVETMVVKVDNLRQKAAEGFINATDLADYLVGKGMAFRDAYRLTGELVKEAIALNTTLEELSLEHLREKTLLIEKDIYDAISIETMLNGRATPGGPAPKAVKAQIDQAKEALSAYRK